MRARQRQEMRDAASRYKNNVLRRLRGGGVWENLADETRWAVVEDLCQVVEHTQRAVLRRGERIYACVWICLAVLAPLTGSTPWFSLVAGGWVLAHWRRGNDPMYDYSPVLSATEGGMGDCGPNFRAHPKYRPRIESPKVKELVERAWESGALDSSPARVIFEADAGAWGIGAWVERRCGLGSLEMFTSVARQQRNEHATMGEVVKLIEKISRGFRT